MCQPASAVVLAVAGGEQVIPSPSFLSFAAANWRRPQTITVRTGEEAVPGGVESASLQHTVMSDDVVYDGMAVEDVTVSLVEEDAHYYYIPLIGH